MQKISKMAVILLSVVCILILSGWGEKSVELLNDKPLIDLNKAIKEVPLGKQGNILIIEDHEESSEEIIINDQNENILGEKSEISQDKVEYDIIIKDTTIIYNGAEYINIEAVKSKINSDCNDMKIKICLIDDFAESHVYKEILAFLDQIELDYQEYVGYN